MTVAGSIKMNARQFLQLGEDPDGVRLELINGDILVSPSPIPLHSIVEKRLSRILLNHILAHELGELLGDTDTIFGPDNVRRPDIIYIVKHRLHLVGKTSLQAPPDLCVEIISPSSATMDRVEKFELYKTHAVPHYWLVDPHALTLEAFLLKDGDYVLAALGRDTQTIHAPPFPNLPIPLSELWPN